MIENQENKASRLDIEVRTDDGTVINIDIVDKRMQFYIAEQIQCVATLDIYSIFSLYFEQKVASTNLVLIYNTDVGCKSRRKNIKK